jgi:hypothetical protein
LNDAEQERIRQGNRIALSDVDFAQFAAMLDSLKRTEKDILKSLIACYLRVVDPDIIAWQVAAKGLGEKSLARLLGQTGHPVHTTRHHWEGSGEKRTLIDDGPYERRVSDLWSYCGHGDPNRRKHTGMSAEDAARLGSPNAKKQVYLIAVSLMKCGDPHYRLFYDKARERYADRVHAQPCVRCGPSGKPAPEGSPWKPSHQNAAALRLLGKEVLRDLWLAGGGK